MTRVVLEGRYELGRELGTGGYARVHEARDLKIDRNVAVKVLLKAFANEPEVAARLEREGRIGARLVHPNICAVSDVGRMENGAPFIVLERLIGETLSARQARGLLPRELTLDIVAQLLTGLGVAHTAGIVHRDIKPENVFLVELGDGKVLAKILDFGLARVPGIPELDGEALTRKGVVVGTAAYMSPEQVRGQRDLDARSDVYTAAVVVFEALTGERPFGDVPPHELLEAIGHRKPPSLGIRVPDAQPAVVRAIDAALSVAREHRPAHATALLSMIRERAPGSGARHERSPDDWDLPTWQGLPVGKGRTD